jgi:hypothetical protein
MLLAMTLFGVTFSGREALIIGAVIVVVLVAVWWIWSRRR